MILNPDKLDAEVIAYIDAHPIQLYSHKAHAALRRLVEAAGWVRAEELIPIAVAKRVSRPFEYALGIFAGEQQRQAMAGPTPAQVKAAKMAEAIRKLP